VLTNDLIAAGDWNKNTVDNPIALRTGAIALTSQAVGDLVIATSTTQLGRVADVAVGQVLVSGGIATAPTYSASPSITALTYTTDLKSTTALATPAALTATQATAFASTVSGSAIMGHGTTNDVSLMNRAGTVVLGIGPNTTAVNMTGALGVSGLLTVSGFGTHTFSAGGSGANNLKVINTTSGTTNLAGLTIDSDVENGLIQAFSSTYTTSGTRTQSALAVRGLAAGGLVLSAEHASGAIKFYSGGSSIVGQWASNGDFYTVAYTDYASTSSITGWSSFTSGRKHINYKKIGKIVFVSFHLEGTSNATSISFTLPYASVSQYGSFGGALTFTYDNTLAKTTAGRVELSSANGQANCFSDANAGTWTASGTKIVTGSFWYQTT
jgi:hypothetical protein